MTNKIAEAVKSLKEANIEELQWQHRVDGLMETHANLLRQNQALQDEIDRKRADFDNYISTKDADNKKFRETVVSEQQKLESQKDEFKKVLQQHEIDKSNLDQAKMTHEIEKNKLTEARGRIDLFVITLQKAYSLIG